ncbi:carboxypeptidase-like protein [Balneicella halophila]|uniref:Carboxypeptidase-like protein n=1 Tax=Balneicella halophila TaxID=1537566 RepID=A0A7L4UT18_BALHA|nr:carboxypeptidase-like regulatory domain-containing protein [Balneicella halophila]PVX52651.1 carboxypeptidase-like protein [Balneicella halophila]
MKTYYLCILFLIQVGYTFSQDEVGIAGIITDESNHPVPDVVIRINWSRVGLLSKNDGSFYITAKRTDTLVFKHLSFEPKAIAVNNLKNLDSLKIQLTSKSFELDEVEINNWGTWQDFKHKIKTMDADSIQDTDEYRLETMFGNKKRHAIANPYHRAMDAPTISTALLNLFNPFNGASSLPTVLYSKLSKDEKMRRQIQKETLQEIAVTKNKYRYTKEYIGRILNIEGKELHSFKMYCDYFINLNQNEYKMIQQIKSLYKDWKKIEDPDIPNSIPPLPELGN